MKNIIRYNKLLVILGPTATGKTKLAVRLAKKYNGEIVSADSRQVYKGMDVGTGKDLGEYRGVKYHLIDVVSPKTEFNLAKYVKMARKAINDIQKRGKLPILVGGSGLYLQAIVDGYVMSDAKPDKKLRAKLSGKSVGELQKMLKELDTDFTGEVQNKRHLVRYIEMVKKQKKPLSALLQKKGSEYDCLVLGVKMPRVEINKRIDKRLIYRIEHEGMIKEVEQLHKGGASWKRLESFGLEYKFVSQYLRGKLSKLEMVEKLKTAIHQFAKRQLTWFRRWEKGGRKIKWVRNYGQAGKLTEQWLKRDVRRKT